MAQLGPGRVERQTAAVAAPGQPFDFACQGCGAFCCTNERLILSPLEVRLLVRATGLDVSALSAAGWLVAYPDPASGIPRVAVEFVPARSGLTACPFLTLTAEGGVPSPLTGTAEARTGELRRRQEETRAALLANVEDGGRHLPLRCGVYAARPAMCRSFPLQVKIGLTADGRSRQDVPGWSALAHCRCPGHGHGDRGQTVGDYLAASGLSTLAEARIAWHDLNLAIAEAGITLPDPEQASRSRRALWDTTSNLLFAFMDRPRMQVLDAAYIPLLHDLFRRYLAPLAPAIDAEARAQQGTLSRAGATTLLHTLADGCAALEVALEEPVPA